MSKLPVPVKVFEQHIAVLGKTRAGKSSTMRVLVEHLLEQKMPVGIVDPKGDWWGLKLAASGKSAGFPIVIFGGEHADVPLNPRAGAQVAELIATGNRPYLIDLKGWMVGDRTRFWIEFSSTLFKLTKGLRWLVVDEIHNFAPKGKIMDPDAGKALHWTNRLASEGLGMGLHMIFASQRPQKVHNDTLTSAETLIAKRVIHPRDRDAIAEWIDGCGDPALGKQVLAGLAGLDRSEGWVWSPEIGFGPELVSFPMFSTYDSFKPQDAKAAAHLKGWASVDLDEVSTKLAAVIEEAKANDPKALRAEVATLKAENAKLTKGQGWVADPAGIKKAEREGYARGEATTAPVWFRRGVEAAMNGVKAYTKEFDVTAFVTKEISGWKNLGAVPQSAAAPAVPRSVSTEPRLSPSRVKPSTPIADGAAAALPVSARKMLAVLDTNPPVRRTWAQVASLAGLKARGGSYNTGKRALLESGLIAENGGLIEIGTPSASATSGNLSPSDLVDVWAANLSGSAPKILTYLFSVGGEQSVQDIAVALDLQPRGGSWNTAWRELRDNDIVSVSGGQATLTSLFHP